MRKREIFSLIAVFVNIVLFLMKIYAYWSSKSLAILSDSFNSLADIFSSIIIFVALRISIKKADYDHPFGHRRAEPIAGLIMAIFASILGFEVIKDAVLSFFKPQKIEITLIVIIILLISIFLKLVIALVFYFVSKKVKSPALKASSIDYRNDVLISVFVLISSGLTLKGIGFSDSIIALIIGLFIIYSGLKIGLENIGYLMGKSPDEETLNRLKEIALSIEGVKSLNDVKAHYLGTYIQLEIHIEVDKNLPTYVSHDIAKRVQHELLKDSEVDFAFIHVDPI